MNDKDLYFQYLVAILNQNTMLKEQIDKMERRLSNTILYCSICLSILITFSLYCIKAL